MTKHLRHKIPSMFIVLLLLPFAIVAGLQVAQLVIKQTASIRFSKSPTVTISFPEKEIVWEKKGREIFYRDAIYDIETFSIQDGIFSAQAHRDEAETMVIHFLVAINKNIKKDVFTFFMLLQLFSCFYFIDVQPPWRQINKALGFNFKSLLTYRPQLVLEQPPQAAQGISFQTL